MTRSECTLDELELIALFDGEATENRARELREHLRGCATCSSRFAAIAAFGARLRAPGMDAPDPGFADAVDRRLSDVRRLPPRLRPRILAAGASALAAAAAIALFVRLETTPGPAEFTARGEVVDWPDLVAVTLSVVADGSGSAESRSRPLTPGARLRPGDGIVVHARNAHPRTPIHLMVYAVDAHGEVHWIAPTWLDPTANPQAPIVPPGGESVALGGAVPERPASGRLEVFTLLSREPLAVQAREAEVKQGRRAHAYDDRRLRSVVVQIAAPAR